MLEVPIWLQPDKDRKHQIMLRNIPNKIDQVRITHLRETNTYET